MSHNRSLFDKASAVYYERKAIETQKKMKEIEECLQRNKMVIKKIFEKNMYSENEIMNHAINGHLSLTIFKWWPNDQISSGFKIGKSQDLNTHTLNITMKKHKYNKCFPNFKDTCKQVKEMFQEINQQNGWGLKLIDNCNGIYDGNLKITWKK